MRQYGINVPPGIAITELDQLNPAIAKMKDTENEVLEVV